MVLLAGGGVLCAHAQTTNQGNLTIANGTQVVAVGAFENTAKGAVANDGKLILRADLYSDGPFTYNDPNGDQGILRLQGNTVQELRGSGLLELPRLTLDNPAGFANAAELSLTKEMTLIQGILNHEDHGGQLWLDGEVTVNGPNDASFVQGDIYVWEETRAVLPTGDTNQFHGLAVRSIDMGSKTYLVRYRARNSNELRPHAQREIVLERLATSGYWSVDRISGVGSARITLSYNDHLAPAVLTADPDRLRVAHWNAPANRWEDLGGVVDRSNSTVSSEEATARFGLFALGMAIDPTDTDGDGVPDYVEINGDPSSDPNDPNDFVDTDGDGVPDYVEEYGEPPTDPNDPNDFLDTDGDGVPDYVEENGDPPTDPNDPNSFLDTDGDGVPDYVEINGDPPTDPNDPNSFLDTDLDGVPDYVEINGDPPTDPNDPNDFIDRDGDNLPDHIQKDKEQGDLQILHEVVSKSGANGFFRIARITEYPENTFSLFNRYGIKVFTMDGYDNATKVFKGFSNTGTLIGEESALADGVYFYVIDYVKAGQKKKRTGYLYIAQ